MRPARRAALRMLLSVACAGMALARARRVNVAMHASACERLATLAERIGKSHVQLAQGVLAERARRALRASQHEFDALLPHAAGLAADAQARDTFVLLGLLWKELRMWSRKPATRDNARQVCERADEVAWVASQAARLVKVDGSSQREALIAMQAATLAQRIARLELLKRIAAPDAGRDGEIANAIAKLGSMLAALAGSPHTLDLEDDLRMAATQHEFLLAAMREYAEGHGSSAAELIAKTSDHIADSMERAARLYENGSG